ncbi:MAG: nucleotidyltransferase family protein, partial [Aggregatilineales bacterium]
SAPQNLDQTSLLDLMKKHGIRQIPLVDDENRVVDLFVLEDILGSRDSAEKLPITAVIMAGGLGTRLRPLTYDVPKPMLPLAGRPMLEWIIEGLNRSGIEDFIITTFHRAEVITEHFGDGSTLDVNIDYVHETTLTGTAGALSSLENWNRAIMVINGDILTKVDFAKMWHFHQSNNAKMSVAIREHQVTIPYGTIELDDARITQILEKPTIQSFINAGIYIISPETKQYFPPKNEFFDMTDLIERLIENDEPVVGFPITEYWLDIGQHHQYEQARSDVHKLTDQDS